MLALLVHRVLLVMLELRVHKVQQDFKALPVISGPPVQLVQQAMQELPVHKVQQDFKVLRVMSAQREQPVQQVFRV